jgi:hypothetical protein
MQFDHKKTHSDQIWTCMARETEVTRLLCEAVQAQGFATLQKNVSINYGFPFVFYKDRFNLSYRLVDSLFLTVPEAWSHDAIITDNIPIGIFKGRIISMVPEFWHIYHFNPVVNHQIPNYDYNCFMNRISGERSTIFYELLKRNILKRGLVSFNCYLPGNNREATDTRDYSKENYEWQYDSAELFQYSKEHQTGLELVPVNNIGSAGLEECIMNSKVSLISETYINDTHIVFSEKLFRAMQLPRPWLLFCSPYSVDSLRRHGFDVLDDYVDHEYDHVLEHTHRLIKIIDQLETFSNKEYNEQDYARFTLAAEHNQTLLLTLQQQWPAKFANVLNEIKCL